MCLSDGGAVRSRLAAAVGREGVEFRLLDADVAPLALPPKRKWGIRPWLTHS